MRCLLQRVKEGRVSIDGRCVAAIGTGLVVLVGFGPEDEADLPGTRLWQTMVDKIIHLRIFPDEAGKMNYDVGEAEGEILLVSQFTLYADTRKGRRPSFHLSAAPEVAEPLFGRLVADVGRHMPGRVRQGVFGAEMEVALTNWGPVTILLDTASFQK